jgi:type II secretory pathway component GspD/PulD (secretin)
MVARATAKAGFNLIAGLVAGVLVLPAPVRTEEPHKPEAQAKESLQVAQVVGRTSARAALNKGIEAQRRGDYEAAAASFQYALGRQDDLTPQERQELARFLRDNGQALQARRDGAELLRRAEQAMQQGRSADVAEMLKKAAATEQYLAGPDKTRLQQLGQQLRGRTTLAPAAANEAASLARVRVQQARAAINQGDWDRAEALARQANQPGAGFNSNEDSPRRVLEDLDLMRRDPKALLQAARLALSRGEYDRAEFFAHQAEKVQPHLAAPWADTPAKVLKEIETARAQAPQNRQPQPPAPATGLAATGRPGPQGPTTLAAATAATVPTDNAADTEKAKALLKQGREALARGDLAQARRCAEQAGRLQPSLRWNEDTPKKLLDEIARREPRRPGAAAAGGPVPHTKEEAQALIEKGRQQLADGKLDEALQTGHRARALTGVSWSLFDLDTPDKLLSDVEKARQRKSKQEAALALAEARRLYDKGDYAAAEQKALRAKTLHGPYNVWEFGDRPDKVLADIQAAREKKQKPKLPPAPLAAKPAQPASREGHRPEAAPTPAQGNPLAGPGSSSPVLEARAQQLLADARLALQNGDTLKARILADQVRAMNVPLNRPGQDSPDAIYRELAARELASRERQRPEAAPRPGNVTPVSANVPVPPGGPPAVFPPGAGTPTPSPAANADSRARILALMAEARQLLSQNKLVEARQKAQAAIAVKREAGAAVSFRPDEESPEMLLQRIAARAHQVVDALAGRANDTLRFGREDQQTRLRKAEQDLMQARQLAAAFGQDAQPLDRSLAWVQQQARSASDGKPNRGGPTPGDMLPPPGIEGTGPVSAGLQLADRGRPATLPPAGAVGGQGEELLNKARLELRAGNTLMARRLAEEACQPRYAVRNEALAVLRNIDIEEFNQKRLTANRTFDAARSAYLRRDYHHAANLIAAIEIRLLDEERRGKLREIMSNPEMQPAASNQLVQAGGAAAGGAAAGGGTPSTQPSALGPEAGRATARDDADRALLAKTLGMNKVRFEKARKDGQEVQSKAAEKFRSGQGDAAIQMLNDYLIQLEDCQLDPGQLTLLRRPVESRLQQFKLLRAQEEFANRKTVAAQVKEERGKLEKAEQVKQKHVQELMGQFNALYKEGKYVEAESMASRAHELDPDNTVVAAAIQMARMQLHRTGYNKLKEARDELWLQGINSAEDEGDPRAVTNDIALNREATLHALERKGGKFDVTSYTPPLKNDKERDIERKLNTPVTLNFTDTPLKTVLADIRAWKDVNIYVDDRALSEHGISLDRPVTQNLDGITLKSALKLLLQPMHLTYVIGDEVLQITTEDQAQGKLRTTTYAVADLVMPVENFGTIDGMPQAWLGTPMNSPMQYTPTPVTGPFSLTQGDPVGKPTASPSMTNGGSPFASAGSGNTGGTQVTTQKGKTNEEVLINLITNAVQPRSWNEMGGPGTIQYFPLTMALVINQTPDIQDQIADLLAALRRLQDQEVAIEIRFISLSDDFFERIGVNFNLNIVNNRVTPRVEQLLNTGQFTPGEFINVFQPKNFLSGLQAAGTLTPDLNIPITNTSFAAAVPPFGGFNQAGLTMGLAYLSDIQVFLFMEAAQGDVRTNIMQAPKLSLFNGQTATLAVTDQQMFTTGVAVTPQMGIFTFQPQSVAFPLGVTLTMNAVISADRRFVRMSLAPTLTNLSQPNVQLFPIVVPIFPLFNGTGTGQPVVFTQFVQQPLISRVLVMTTVAVPDGGTVLMGGIKRLAEGRTEYGPPVLSKIPWINRLFKNVGYGRDTESLLIMVTPRIIIQAEEEERQTGVVIPPAVIP